MLSHVNRVHVPCLGPSWQQQNCCDTNPFKLKELLIREREERDRERSRRSAIGTQKQAQEWGGRTPPLLRELTLCAHRGASPLSTLLRRYEQGGSVEIELKGDKSGSPNTYF